jgi:hypothetical protein
MPCHNPCTPTQGDYVHAFDLRLLADRLQAEGAAAGPGVHSPPSAGLRQDQGVPVAAGPSAAALEFARRLPSWSKGLHSLRFAPGPEWVTHTAGAAQLHAQLNPGSSSSSSGADSSVGCSAVLWVTGAAAREMSGLSDEQVRAPALLWKGSEGDGDEGWASHARHQSYWGLDMQYWAAQAMARAWLHNLPAPVLRRPNAP